MFTILTHEEKEEQVPAQEAIGSVSIKKSEAASASKEDSGTSAVHCPSLGGAEWRRLKWWQEGKS